MNSLDAADAGQCELFPDDKSGTDSSDNLPEGDSAVSVEPGHRPAAAVPPMTEEEDNAEEEPGKAGNDTEPSPRNAEASRCPALILTVPFVLSAAADLGCAAMHQDAMARLAMFAALGDGAFIPPQKQQLEAEAPQTDVDEVLASTADPAVPGCLETDQDDVAPEGPGDAIMEESVADKSELSHEGVRPPRLKDALPGPALVSAYALQLQHCTEFAGVCDDPGTGGSGYYRSVRQPP